MAEDDCRLMLRYASGDLQAFAALYARHRAALYRYLARHVRERAAADDLFQEVWSRVIAHRAHYEPRAKFSTFLYRIAHNCCVDHLRRAAALPPHQRCEEGIEARAEEGGRRAIEPANPSAPDAEGPEARAEQAELLARYREALERLPAEQRDVFLLYEQSGLTLEEIAAVTGVGAETAKSRLRYALAKLRSALTLSHAPAAAPVVRDGQRAGGVRPITEILAEPGS